ncbi:MAG: PA2779 family protein [Betaproteobacteria bacterium]
MTATFRAVLARLLIVCTVAMGFPGPAQAALVATDAALAPGTRERVMSALERSDVRDRLQAYGVPAEDVKARLAALSDDELAQLASGLDRLPAGGDSIIGAIVFVFLVLLITDILGLTKIFPFTRSVR